MRKSFLVTIVAVTLAVLVPPQSSFAGGGPRDHLGFFLRMTAGGTYASSSDGFEVNGWGGDFTFALGGCVSENLALHGSLFSWSMSDPDLKIGGLEGQLDGDFGMAAYGGGVTYYFMPSNFYISGNVGLGFLSIDSGSVDETSDPGIAIDALLGKEWWVGNSWGLGLAGAFGYHNIEDFSGWNASLRFTATFN
jgi:hypothetical protein